MARTIVASWTRLAPLTLCALSTIAACSSDDAAGTGHTPETAGGSTAGGTGGSVSNTSTTGLGGESSSGGSSGTGGSNVGTGGSDDGTGGSDGTGGTTVDYADYTPCPEDGSTCKIMPLGDSITDGYDFQGGYRVELFRRAHSEGKDITFVGSMTSWYPDPVDGVDFPTSHEGHSFYTISSYGNLTGLTTEIANVGSYSPDIVLLMIGTNDAYAGYNMDDAPARLSALIGSIYEQKSDVLLVLAQIIPTLSNADYYDTQTLIENYNATMPAIVETYKSQGKHIVLVDMYTPFAPNKASLLNDIWHPNLAGYALLGTHWYNVLEPYLP